MKKGSKRVSFANRYIIHRDEGKSITVNHVPQIYSLLYLINVDIDTYILDDPQKLGDFPAGLFRDCK